MSLAKDKGVFSQRHGCLLPKTRVSFAKDTGVFSQRRACLLPKTPVSFAKDSAVTAFGMYQSCWEDDWIDKIRLAFVIAKFVTCATLCLLFCGRPTDLQWPRNYT